MKIELTALEARVIGCLIEKQITTPDQYPLSINALLNACNQKSNREPVLALNEPEVQRLLDDLLRKHLVIENSGLGSRVKKYQHCFCNTTFSSLQFTPPEQAIICELLLRGPQTPGELRSRASRMAELGDATQVEAALEALAAREPQSLVVKLAREPGRRESRYAHLLSSAVAAPASPTPVPAHAARPSYEERLARLEQEVEALRAAIESMRVRNTNAS
jgi:uncharacterized protein YceH (UPF0502 family)